MDNNINTSEFEDILGGSTTGNSQSETNDSKPVDKTTTDNISNKDLDTYSDNEIIDVNAIITNISDTTTPIVIFFGPASSGKTMALLRMIQYFYQNKKYHYSADPIFRPSYDRHYQRMCKNLNALANNNYAPAPNDDISFMLVTIYDEGGKAILQILEAPGEHYFNPAVPDAPFPAYIEQIIHSIPNRKIWCYFIEQDWKDQSDRNNYAAKISQMQSLTPHDKVIFLFNKCDRHMYQYDNNGHPKVDLYIRKAEQQYPGIFNRYKNTGIAKILFGQYRFIPVCFSSGTFTTTNDHRQRWTVSNQSYCDELWKAMRNS